MINQNPVFQVNFLKKTLVVRPQEDIAVCVALLDIRKKIKIAFPTQKRQVWLATASPLDKDYYFINLNQTVFESSLKLQQTYVTGKNYPIRYKIKWRFKKFKYRGKGFKIKKFNKLSKVTFKMGKSHWTKALFDKKVITIKRTKKNTYTCITIRTDGLKNLLNIVQKAKGVNRYTKRGVRLTRQTIKKRFGKISQASSVYK